MWWGRKTLRSSKLIRRRRQSFALKILFFITTVLFLIAGLTYLLRRPEVNIQDIDLKGNEMVSSEKLNDFIKEETSGNYFFIFPRSSIFIYPRNFIEKSILSNFKRIENVQIVSDGFNSILVNVRERKPVALWCGENRLEGAIPECFFIDENGFLYARSPAFTGDVYFRFYGSLRDSISIGQWFLPEKKFKEILFFLQSLQKSDIQATDLAIDNEDDYELYLESGARVLFAQDSELSIVLDNLRSALLSDDLKDNGIVGIDYIDLRFGNKVYYKFLDK